MPAEKRHVRITAANSKHSHLYVTGPRDFFPPEAFGGAKRKNGEGGDRRRRVLHKTNIADGRGGFSGRVDTLWDQTLR